MHESIGELIRTVSSHDKQAPLTMYVARAGVSEALEGGPGEPSKRHEAVAEQCGRVEGRDRAFVLHSKENSSAALGRGAGAPESYGRAAGIGARRAAAHAGRGGALAALGRDAEAHAAREAASRLPSDANRA